MTNEMAILVTGAGAPGIRGTLYALRNNSDNRKVRIIGVDIKKDVVGRYLVDTFCQVPPPEGPDYLDYLFSLCQKEKVDIVIPQTTREVDILSRSRSDLLAAGIRVMVSPWPAIQIANNKWKLIEEFQRLGLPVPKYYLARSEQELRGAVLELGYPSDAVVVKPPFSNGMRGVRVLKEDAWDVRRFLSDKPNGLEISLEELIRVLRKGESWPELLVTEHLPGPEYSVDLFVGEFMAIALPRLRRSIRSGITFEAVCEQREDLSNYSLTCAKHLGLRYAFGFQYKLDKAGIPKILECNPRVQGTMVASLFTGCNVIWWAVKELTGEPPRETSPKIRDASFYRFWGGIGVSGDIISEI